jgi:hypothetical protein
MWFNKKPDRPQGTNPQPKMCKRISRSSLPWVSYGGEKVSTVFVCRLFDPGTPPMPPNPNPSEPLPEPSEPLPPRPEGKSCLVLLGP